MLSIFSYGCFEYKPATGQSIKSLSPCEAQGGKCSNNAISCCDTPEQYSSKLSCGPLGSSPMMVSLLKQDITSKALPGETSHCCMPTTQCIDSDNGDDPSIAGTTIGFLDCDSDSYSKNEDACTDLPSQMSQEFYCEEGFVKQNNYICQGVCSDGRCIQNQ